MYFYPNDGRPAIPFTSTNDIVKYMGEIMNKLGPIEIYEGHVLTQIDGLNINIGEVR